MIIISTGINKLLKTPIQSIFLLDRAKNEKGEILRNFYKKISSHTISPFGLSSLYYSLSRSGAKIGTGKRTTSAPI